MDHRISKFIVVKEYDETDWDVYKAQYLTTVEEARAYVKDHLSLYDDDYTKPKFRIFELSEVHN